MSQDAITARHAMRILGVDERGLRDLCIDEYLTPLHFPGGDLRAYWALPTLPGGYSWQDLVFSLSAVNSLAEFRKRKAEELEARATALLQEAENSTAAGLSAAALGEWEAVLPQCVTAAMKTRLTIYIRRARGEKVAVLRHEFPGRNIQRDLREAEEKDQPKMKSRFPNLPALPPRPR